MIAFDPSKVATDQLVRSLKFHERDLTETEAEECRRLFLVSEISTELLKRGVDPWELT